MLVAGLGFGRQVLKWWAVEAVPTGGAAVTPLGDGLGDPMKLHTIQFGDSSWTLRRQSIVGDKQHAIEQLRAACREVLKTTFRKPPTAAVLGKRARGRREMARISFLALLSESTPVDEERGEVAGIRVHTRHSQWPSACVDATWQRPASR